MIMVTIMTHVLISTVRWAVIGYPLLAFHSTRILSSTKWRPVGTDVFYKVLQMKLRPTAASSVPSTVAPWSCRSQIPSYRFLQRTGATQHRRSSHSRIVVGAAAQEKEVGKFISKTEIPAFIPREVRALLLHIPTGSLPENNCRQSILAVSFQSI